MRTNRMKLMFRSYRSSASARFARRRKTLLLAPLRIEFRCGFAFIAGDGEVEERGSAVQLVDKRRFAATRCQSPSPPVAAAIVAFRALPLDRIVQRLSIFRNLERLRRLM